MRRRGTSSGALRRLATLRARSFGAVGIANLAALVPDGGQAAIGEIDALFGEGLADLLCEGWLWFPGDEPNRLLALTRRMLAVCTRLDTPTIRAGICRACRPSRRALVPPADVLAALYDAHPYFAADALGRVRSTVRLDPTAELPRSERVLVDVLRSSWTGLLGGAALKDACMARGLSARVLEGALAHSVVVDRPGYDVWCVRGTRVTAVTVAALQFARDVHGLPPSRAGSP